MIIMSYSRTFIISLLIFLPYALSSQVSEILETGFYFGYIEEVYPIGFEILEEDGNYSGTVFFPLSGDSILVEIDELGDRYMLTEFDEGQAVIGFYFLKREKNAWVGNWQNRIGDQSLNLEIRKIQEVADWRDNILADKTNEKWLKRYRLNGEEKWTDLHILRLAGSTANAVLSHESEKGQAIYLRGDCIDWECKRLLFLNKSGEEDLLLEVNLNGTELSGFYFFQNREKAINADWRETLPVRAKYVFNQWMVFDAHYPDIHPLMAGALEERLAEWMSIASSDWLAKTEQEYPTVWDRFSSRHYVWFELLHINEEFLSGYIEWIQNDRSVKMNSFIMDLRNREWYWSEDLVEKALNPYMFFEEQLEAESKENGVFVVVPGGWQKITPLDKITGRNYQFFKVEDVEMRIPRTYRNWFR